MQNPYQNFLNDTSNQYNQQRYGGHQFQQQGGFQQPVQQGYQPQQFQQPVQSQPIVNQNLVRSEIVQVNGIEGAKNYGIAPNSGIIMIDKKEPIIYILETDSGGYGDPIAYQLVKIDTSVNAQVGQGNDLETRIKRLEEQLEVLNESIIESESRGATSSSEPKSSTGSRSKSGTTASNK